MNELYRYSHADKTIYNTISIERLVTTCDKGFVPKSAIPELEPGLATTGAFRAACILSIYQLYEK